jgi:hypothetical protein
MPGLVLGIHLAKMMDCRGKSGNDAKRDGVP